ncbi:hypothetical protein LTR37_000282 [Vermiconidia calcicola]|uniref:Uncharacterized protein n=1 Tax=Vermiconidia calcicola TaxID=1690605 RepID=A0ACC3NZX1_9PEZI|nr:hypothetical protein LTR37_000282 [Vermiconidia calcicola]
MTAQKQASLLGLPVELRHNIYDHIFNLELQCKVLDGYSKGGDYSRYSAIRSQGAKLQLPWLNLMFTCNSIAKELCSYMTLTIFTEDKTNHTYELTLEVRQNRIASVTWNKIPCQPSYASTIVANIGAIGPYDDGPRPIMAELHQTLNLLLHCGPLLDTKRPLRESMLVAMLLVNVQLADERSDDIDFHMAMIIDEWARHLAAAGVLSGYVGCIQLNYGDATGDVVIVQREKARISDRWMPYRFGWGVGR